MTPMEAWGIVSSNLNRYANEKGYTKADIEAEVICFYALKKLEEIRIAEVRRKFKVREEK